MTSIILRQNLHRTLASVEKAVMETICLAKSNPHHYHNTESMGPQMEGRDYASI